MVVWAQAECSVALEESPALWFCGVDAWGRFAFI